MRFIMQAKVADGKGAEVPLNSVPSNGSGTGKNHTRVIKKVKRLHTSESTETSPISEMMTTTTHTDTENLESDLMAMNLVLSDKAQQRRGEGDEENTEPMQQTTPTSVVAYKPRSTLPLVEDDSVGPFFCYLMIQLGGPCKNEAKVLVARECFEDAYRHNSGEINDKGTKAARGLWQVEMIVGPFDARQEADDFKKLWMQDSRGIGPRRERAIELINQGVCPDKVKCFDKRLVPVNLNAWLLENDMACLVLPDDRIRKLYYDCSVPTKRSDAHTPNV